MKKATIYASKTGVEFTPATVVKGNGSRELKTGRIKIRAFSMEEKGKMVYVFLTPMEAHKLGRYLEGITTLSEAKKLKPIIHKLEKDGEETVSTVEVERWVSKDGKKSGYAIVVSRDKESINIPMDKDTVLYLADFLKALSIEQSWEQVRKIEKAGEEVEEVAEDDEIPEDIEDAF